MQHAARDHAEVLYVQEAFLRCLNFVIRYTTTSTDGSEPHYQVLKQSYSDSGSHRIRIRGGRHGRLYGRHGLRQLAEGQQ